VEDALSLLAAEEHVFVIGGAEIYAASLPHADQLLLTEIELDVEGDTVFPHWDHRAFEETGRDERVSADGTGFSFASYRRWAGDAQAQLAALATVTALLEREHIAHWLFGGWAVDFYAGSVTRRHDDIDLAVWEDDAPRIAELVAAEGWEHTPEPDEDGGTGYERDHVRLELTFLRRRDDGRVVIPLREGEAPWPDGALGDDERRLDGVAVSVVALEALRRGKSSPRTESDAAAKDLADSATLARL
jgi:hypothetical protein